MTPQNCWEFMRCGREPGGSKENELGVCPVPLQGQLKGNNRGMNGGRICWEVAGTLCGGKVQGTFATKKSTCLACDFFTKVKKEEGESGNIFRMVPKHS